MRILLPPQPKLLEDEPQIGDDAIRGNDPIFPGVMPQLLHGTKNAPLILGARSRMYFGSE